MEIPMCVQSLDFSELKNHGLARHRGTQYKGKEVSKSFSYNWICGSIHCVLVTCYDNAALTSTNMTRPLFTLEQILNNIEV
jgi:hypothetical protein